jgi:hypothetical protein
MRSRVRLVLVASARSREICVAVRVFWHVPLVWLVGGLGGMNFVESETLAPSQLSTTGTSAGACPGQPAFDQMNNWQSAKAHEMDSVTEHRAIVDTHRHPIGSKLAAMNRSFRSRRWRSKIGGSGLSRRGPPDREVVSRSARSAITRRHRVAWTFSTGLMFGGSFTLAQYRGTREFSRPTRRYPRSRQSQCSKSLSLHFSGRPALARSATSPSTIEGSL